jgi:hypothetical protein
MNQAISTIEGKRSNRIRPALVACLLMCGTLFAACESETPSGQPDGTDDGAVDDGEGGADADVDTDADSSAEADAEADTEADADVEDEGEVPVPCAPLATDYQPRTGTDDWPACISDDNTYHQIGASISTVARIAAFEQIADLLWRRATPPGPADFTSARVSYTETNGLDSRVQRREDLHYPAVPAADGACTDAGVPELYPDRCVGPARILPILNQAFADGPTTTEPLVAAARIEAALLWFLYLSPYKESFTCTDTPADCDSAWAYYTGGEDRSAGLGLATYVRDLDAETHDRIWDGLLAVRCWKNLDNETGVSTDLATRDRARAQLDRALIRGVALIVRDRFDDLRAATTDEQRRADWEFLKLLGGVLDREAVARDPANAEVLRVELGRSDPAVVDIDAAQEAIDLLFPCP